VTSEYGGVCKIFDAKNFELIASFGRSHPDERAWCCDLDFRETSKNKFQIFVGYEVNRCNNNKGEEEDVLDLKN